MNRFLIQFVAAIVGREVLVFVALNFNPALAGFLQLLLIGWLAYLFWTHSVGFVQEYERVYVLRLGREAGTRGPGFYLAIAPFEVARRINTQIFTQDLEETSVLTSDAVTVRFRPSFKIKVTNAGEAA